MSVVAGAGEDGDAVERAAGGDKSPGAEQAAGGLEADEIVERGGDAAGAGGVGAECETDQAGGDGDGRAGAGSARDVARVEDAGTGAVGGARAHQAGGELVEIGFADGDGAGVHQGLHDGGVAAGRVGVSRAAGGGGNAGHVDIVLDGEGDAEEGFGGGERIGFQLAGAGDGDFARDQGDPYGLDRPGVDAPVDLGDHFGRAGFARAVEFAERAQVEGDVRHHAATSWRTVTRFWPAETRAPCAQFNVSMVPGKGAATAISIFMASRTMSFSPASTRWPGSTAIFQTLAVTGEGRRGNLRARRLGRGVRRHLAARVSVRAGGGPALALGFEGLLLGAFEAGGGARWSGGRRGNRAGGNPALSMRSG